MIQQFISFTFYTWDFSTPIIKCNYSSFPLHQFQFLHQFIANIYQNPTNVQSEVCAININQYFLLPNFITYVPSFNTPITTTCECTALCTLLLFSYVEPALTSVGKKIQGMVCVKWIWSNRKWKKKKWKIRVVWIKA